MVWIRFKPSSIYFLPVFEQHIVFNKIVCLSGNFILLLR